MPTAVITGASRGLGAAVAHALAARRWHLIVDARDGAALHRMVDELPHGGTVVSIAGDVRDPDHQRAIQTAVAERGGLDLLLNNASSLGPSPRPTVAATPIEAARQVLEVNTLAPLALTQQLLEPLRTADGVLINVTSDVAIEALPGWGIYSASKAALEQLTAVLAEEEPRLPIYLFDPGDLRTTMHQEAFPDEDISDRPLPEEVVPALLRLLDERPASDRYQASDLALAVPR